MNDKELATFLDADGQAGIPPHHRQLEDYGGLDRCNTKDNPCENDGFTCTNLPFGQDRCIPTDCIKTELNAFNTAYDMKAYKARILDSVGLSESEVIEKVRSLGDREFATSTTYTSLMEALRADSAPMEAYQEIFNKCMGNNDRQLEEDEEPMFGAWLGIHIEGGLILDASITYMDEFRIFGDTPRNFLRTCIGAEAGVGAELSFVLGGAFVGSVPASEVPCASVWADIDAAVGVAAGAAVGIAFNGNGFFEFSAGLGLGVGAGASVCGTFAL